MRPLAVAALPSPIPGMFCGVAASWPRIALTAPSAATTCCSILASSVRAADMRWAIVPSPGNRPVNRWSNSTRRCSASCKLGLAPAQLLVEELERLAGLAAVARQILLDEQVDQALDGGGGGAGILTVGEARDIGARADLDHAVGLGDDHDPLAQRGNDAAEVALAGDQRFEIGAADDADQILVRGQGLLQAQQLVLRSSTVMPIWLGRIDCICTNRRALAS